MLRGVVCRVPLTYKTSSISPWRDKVWLRQIKVSTYHQNRHSPDSRSATKCATFSTFAALDNVSVDIKMQHRTNSELDVTKQSRDTSETNSSRIVSIFLCKAQIGHSCMDYYVP